MNGEQMAAEIKRLSPRLPVILLTSYGTDDSLLDSRAGTIDLVLGKPLLRSGLRAGIASVMAGAAEKRSDHLGKPRSHRQIASVRLISYESLPTNDGRCCGF